MTFSIIIPVYNRPEELHELLASIKAQKELKNLLEVIVVDDGSKEKCDKVAALFSADLPIKYFFKKNSGPGPSRNYGAQFSTADYLLILDSDCILPPNYLKEISLFLSKDPVDAFGGPDAAHPSFTPTQKAINYSMTSFLTTGGIRGGKKKLDKFYPRSFNMGIKRQVFHELKGFSPMRFGEDIDLSIRIFSSGFSCKLIPSAWVYHKRRTNLKKFFKQVFNSGIARINLYKKYPSSLKLVHLLPSLFTLGVCLLFILAFAFKQSFYLTPIIGYAILLFIDSTLRNKSFTIGILSIAAAFTQLIAYGGGFIIAWISICILKKDTFSAFEKNFYN